MFSFVRDTLFGEPSTSAKGRSGRNASPGRSVNDLKKDSHDHGGKHLFGFLPSRNSRQIIRLARRERVSKLSLCKLLQIFLMVFLQTVIGALSILTFGYSTMKKDWHVFLITEGWFFYMGEAILAVSFTNMWGRVRLSTLRRVRCLHLVLQCIGAIHVFCGTNMVIKKKPKQMYSSHSFLGMVTAVMSIASLLSGPCAIFSRYNQGVKFFHSCLGLPTFVMASVVVLMAIQKAKFVRYITIWAVYVLIVEIVCFTAYIIVVVMINAYTRMRFTVNTHRRVARIKRRA